MKCKHQAVKKQDLLSKEDKKLNGISIFLNRNSKTTTSEKLKVITSKDRKHQREKLGFLHHLRAGVVIVVNPNASSVICLIITHSFKKIKGVGERQD